jgi:hypothetical protein
VHQVERDSWHHDGTGVEKRVVRFPWIEMTIVKKYQYLLLQSLSPKHLQLYNLKNTVTYVLLGNGPHLQVRLANFCNFLCQFVSTTCNFTWAYLHWRIFFGFMR